MRTGAGHQPNSVSETVSARMPTEDEAAQLRIGSRVRVISVERLTRDAQSRAPEMIEVSLQLTASRSPMTTCP
ncbi:UTRA domain-containing protein [Streptomyces virginiae]|uniref:UTRA domain-containing protein n=1 Tax=Streptomyces virginiae TaxID=1961 RepID=UPI0036E20724